MISDRIDSYIPMDFDCIYDFANISTVGTDIVLDVTPVAARCPNHRATGSQNCKVSNALCDTSIPLRLSTALIVLRWQPNSSAKV